MLFERDKYVRNGRLYTIPIPLGKVHGGLEMLLWVLAVVVSSFWDFFVFVFVLFVFDSIGLELHALFL
jgi:hypothetical protein